MARPDTTDSPMPQFASTTHSERSFEIGLAVKRTPAESAVMAVAAGCDGVLVCSGNLDAQAATLEALVKAVESGVVSHARLDDATRRIARQKARFLADRLPARERLRRWRQVVGCEEHQLVAAEMATFA